MKKASTEYKKAPKPKKAKKKKSKIKHEGGAIRDPKQVELASPPIEKEPVLPSMAVDFHDILTPLVPRVLHGAPRILLESGAPYFMLREPTYPDQFLLTDLKNTVKPGGMSDHHPEIRRVVFDSFEKHPRLLQHYLRT